MGTRPPRAVAIIGGVAFIAVGMWAMVDPTDAQLLAFEDSWRWGPSAEATYAEM